MIIPNSLYPVFLQLHDKTVLVVGGGTIAERKVRALLPSGARVCVGTPELTPTLQSWVEAGTISRLAGHFTTEWLDGAQLVIAATNDRQVNAHISQLASQRGIWINVVDDPELSTFQVPAVVDRAPITIAISSGGHSPVLARRLRERLETLVDHGIGRLAGMLAQRRPAIRAAYPDLAQRRQFYDWTLDGPALALISKGTTHAAATLLDQHLNNPTNWPRKLLTVLAAPSHDPGQLTLKGLRALHQADALLYDPRLHDEAVLAMARRDAERLPVHLEAWLENSQAAERTREILEEHGRVALLTVKPKGSESDALKRVLSELESSEIVLENI